MTSVGAGFITVGADLVGRNGIPIVNPLTNLPILIEITETEFTSGGQRVFQTFNFSNRIETEGLEFEEDLEVEEIFGTTLPGGLTGIQFVSLTSLPPFVNEDTVDGGNGDGDGGGGDDTTGGNGDDTTDGGDGNGGDDTTGGNGDDTTGGNGDDDTLRSNQPPVGENDQFQTKQGDPVFFNVLANDTDPDGDTLSIGTFTQTQNGTLSFAGAGIFTYEPNREFFGVDGFSYTVTDGTATDLAEVLINVIPQDLPILIEGIGKGTVEDDTITGSSGDDVIDGLEGNDSIFGLAGNDQVRGNEGNDFLFGNPDNDTLEGGTGNDQIYGGKQSDRLVGDEGDDGLFGNLGEDTLLGGQGRDSMYGGQSNDSLRGGIDDDLVFGDKDSDVAWGDEGNDSVYGGSGEDLIFGNDGADSLLGDLGNDTIFAGTGSDTALGGEDNDQISGEVGSDFLFGGVGADTLTGGTGSDTFAIAEGTGGQSIEESNIVQDFQPDDFIGLAGGLNFSDLDISQSSENAGDTIIRLGEEGEYLAVLLGVDSGSLTENNFVSVSLDNLPTPPTPTPTPPTPTPTEPTPTPTEPTPTPTEPTPTPTEPTPTPTEPTPTPTEPTPTPTEPTPTPTEPTPTEPTPVNRPPVANDDVVRRGENQPVTFNVLTNDSDPDGDVIQINAFSSTTGGQLINQGGGVFTYVPRSGFLGTDAFRYTITDSRNNTATALVTIGVNQPPELANNQLLVVDLSDPQATTISRDILLAVDPDNPPSQIQYIITQGTQRGDLVRLGSQTQPLRVGDRFTQEQIDSGSIRYDGSGPAGADEFIFAVTDGIGTLPQTFFNITLVDRALNTTPGKATTGSDLGELLVGTDVDDTLLGGGGRDVMRGLGGNDSLDGGTGNDVIEGGSGDDTQLGQEGNDSLVGGSGNDLLDGAAGLNTLQGDDGNDILIGGDETNTLDGGKGNDSLTSGLGSDSLVGGIADDTVNGNAGDDTLRGDQEDLTLPGGNDLVLGGAGRDFIRGGEGDDTLLGQDNSDVVAGDRGSDSISGDQGDDTLLGDTGINSLNGGNDTVSGGVGNDNIFGEKGNDSLIGEQGQDSIFGGDNDDVIFGREDSDLMFGDGGNDSIRGGIGDDTMAGGAGGDLLISDDGNDVFYYVNPGEGVDVINDFDVAGNDRFLIVSGTSNFPGLISNVGTSTPLQSIIVTSLGSEGDDITGRQLIIFRDTFDDVQAVNAQLANQNGSDESSALIVYRNNLSFPGFPGNYVLAFDPDLSDDSLPAFNLAIFSSIDPSTDNISTIIGSDDFTII